MLNIFKDLKKQKKANANVGALIALVLGMVFIIIGFVITLTVFADTSPEVISSLTAANDTGLPLARTLYNPEHGVMAYLYVLLPFIIGAGLIVGAIVSYKKGAMK